MPRRKSSRFKRNVGIAVTVIVLMIVSVVATLSTQLSGQKVQTSGSVSSPTLNVGDRFTYKLTGVSVLGSPDAVTPAEFTQYNDTDYYQVTVARINGTQVSLDLLWRFNNGTLIESAQAIDLATGAYADPTGFCYLYPSNLNVKDRLYPEGTSGLIVNGTSPQKFANSTRAANYWSMEDQFINTGDQTLNTMRGDAIAVYFDKQTGMLDNLTRIEFFTNPEIELTITWRLTGSNVWAVQ
jgi:hypothetical protein